MFERGRPPTSLKVVYSSDMVSDAGRYTSPSDRKPMVVAEALLATDWLIEMIAPEPAALADLSKVHDPQFVEDVLELKRRNGFGSMSPSVARSLAYTSGACYCSGVIALNDHVSASLTSGFHHAGPRASRGFCTFNGLMLTAVQLLDEGRVSKVAIVDADYHYGDGTQAIIDTLNLSARVLHVSLGQKFKRPDQAGEYLAAMRALSGELSAFEPGL